MKVIVFSLLIFGLAWADLSCDCGKRNTGRIIVRKSSRNNEYPWMVAVQKNKDNVTFCGGAILTLRHIISAAHCFREFKAEDVTLIVGGNDPSNLSNGTTKRHYVEKNHLHPGFNKETLANDIAILVTSTGIEYSKFVGPVCMPNKLLGDEMIGQIAKAMGWGINNTKATFDNKLKEVDLKIISHKICREAASPLFCTYTVRESTCIGDSGGPLAWLDPETNRFTLVGVVSFGYEEECDTSIKPGININVSAYLEWINHKINDVEGQVMACYKI